MESMPCGVIWYIGLKVEKEEEGKSKMEYFGYGIQHGLAWTIASGFFFLFFFGFNLFYFYIPIVF